MKGVNKVSKILATGQITLLNMINNLNLNGFITSNLPATQTIQNNTYAPSWVNNNLILTAELYKIGQSENLCINDNHITAIRWYYKRTTDNQLQNISTLNSNDYEIINRYQLKIKNNLMNINNPNILFRCEIDYQQSENLPIFTYKMDITFTLAQQGVSGQDAYSIFLTRDNAIFESDTLGNNIQIENNDTEVIVKLGVKDITSACNIILKNAYNCTGEKVSGTNNKFRILSVTNGKTNGYLEIEIQHNGNVIATKRFGFSLSRRGLPGAPGAKGQQFNNRGAWAPGIKYKNNYTNGTDIVEYNGSRFYCLQDHTSSDSNKPDSNIPPSSNDYWGVLSARGASGYDSTSYWLISNVVAIKERADNKVYEPYQIQVNAKKQTGQGNIENYTGMFKIAYSVDYITWTEYLSNTNSQWTFNIPNINFKYLRIQLYTQDGSTLLDQQIIPVVQENSDAVTVVLTNENVTIAASDTGVVDNTQLLKLTTNVVVYRGANVMQPNGTNKWIRRRYSKINAGTSVPTKTELSSLTIIENDTIIDDANVTSSLNLGDNYVGYIMTYVWCDEDVSFTTNIFHNDSYAIYINDILQSSDINWNPSHPVTLTFKKGINKIECLWGESTGGDGFGFHTALSNQNTYIKRMNCYGLNGYTLAIQNQTPDIGISINTTTGNSLNAPSSVTTNLNNNDNGSVDLVITTFDGITLSKKFTWTKMRAGKPAAYVIVTGPQIFKYNANSSVCTPSTINLTATTFNIPTENRSYQWYYNNGSGFQIISGATEASYTVNPSSSEWSNGKVSVTYKCVVTQSIYSYSDEITVVKLYDTPSYTVILTNETHTIACDSSGNPLINELAKATSNVMAYFGTQALSAVSGTPSTGQFSISVSGNGCSASVDSSDKSKFKLDSLSADSGSVTVTINLENKTTTIKIFTWSKTKAGKKGTSYRFRGAWLSSETYLNNEDYVDTVEYQGSVYACVQTNTNKNPVTETAYWQLMVAKGAPGQDANLLDWVADWNNNKTQIKDWQVITPRLFAGTNTGTAQEPMISGVAIGKNILGTSDEIIGIAGYSGNIKTFEFKIDGSAVFGNQEGRQIKINTDGSVVLPKIKTSEIIFSADEEVTYDQVKETQNTLLYLDDYDAHYWNFDFDLYSHTGIGPIVVDSTEQNNLPQLVSEGYYANAVRLINNSITNPILKYEGLNSGTNFTLLFKVKFTQKWYQKTINLGQEKILFKLEGNSQTLFLKDKTSNLNSISYPYFEINGTQFTFPFAYEIDRWYTFALRKKDTELYLLVYDNLLRKFIIDTKVFGNSLILTRNTQEINPLFAYNGAGSLYVNNNNFIIYNPQNTLIYPSESIISIIDYNVYNIPTSIDSNFNFTKLYFYGTMETYVDELVIYQNKSLTNIEMKSLLILDEVFYATKKFITVPSPQNVTCNFVD